MWSALSNTASTCWKPFSRYSRMSKDDSDEDGSVDLTLSDSLLWYRDLEKHSYGEFSFAVVQANEVIEDQSQVEIGNDATFVGVYDGHGGPEASRYISDHLFKHLMRCGEEDGCISEDTVRRAFSATEEGFLSLVRRSRGIKPLIAATGSCCLVGVIWRGTLYVGNVGDSRAVIGSSSSRSNDKVVAEQLTRDHNASVEEVREEVRLMHPDDSDIVVNKHGVWRIKGIIQVTRSIGDAYLKKPEFAIDSSFPRFHLPEPIRRPVLTAEPSTTSRVLNPEDKFIIFASDGLWEHLTNQEAVDIVNNRPRSGIARRLLRVALNEAARERNMSYEDVMKYERGNRRCIHDDITVIVVFLDHQTTLQSSSAANTAAPHLSIKSFADTTSTSSSSFNFLQRGERD